MGEFCNYLSIRFIVLVILATILLGGSLSSRMTFVKFNQDTEPGNCFPCSLGCYLEKAGRQNLQEQPMKKCSRRNTDSCLIFLIRLLGVENIFEPEKFHEEVCHDKISSHENSYYLQKNKESLLAGLSCSQTLGDEQMLKRISGVILVFLMFQKNSLKEKLNRIYQEISKNGCTSFSCMAVVKIMLSFVSSTGIKHHDDDTYSQDKIGEKDKWMYDPNPWISPFISRYCFTVLDRVASFRQLVFQGSPNAPSSVLLAQAGFKLSPTGSTVECQGCGRSVSITEFNSSATEVKYHREGCNFIIADEPQGGRDHVEEEPATTTTPEVLHQLYHQPENHQLHHQPENHCDNLWPHSATDDNARQPADQTSNTTVQSLEQTRQAEASLLHQNTPSVHQSSPLVHQNQQNSVNQQKEELFPFLDKDKGVVAAAAGPTHSKTASNPGTVSNNGGTSNPGIADNLYETFLNTTTEFESEDGYLSSSELDHTCEKNQGHYTYFPTNRLKLEHIPSNVRDAKFYQFIQLIARLTVRIRVSVTSKDRPHFMKTKNTNPRCGTGFVAEQQADPQDNIEKNNKNPGKWSTIRKHLQLKKSRGNINININTNSHFIFDDKEAESAVVEFNYSSSSRGSLVTAKGVSIKHSPIPGDNSSTLICRISDAEFVESIKKLQEELSSLFDQIPQKIKERLTKRVFVISHPHGQEKVMSYGEHVMVKYALRGNPESPIRKINNHTQISNNPDNIRKVLLYTADTCEGSSGAVVLSFKKTSQGGTEKVILDLWMHNGVHRSSGLNASTMRALTTEDVLNHGKPSPDRSGAAEDQDLEPDSSDNPVTSCPVFTVSSPPTHPAYVSYSKRLESYPDGFNHVQTAVNLADAGFFYAGYADCVRCFQCGLGLRSWKPGDDIYQEHARNRPDCQFLQMKLRATGIDPQRFQPNTQRGRDQSSDSRNENSHEKAASMTLTVAQPPVSATSNVWSEKCSVQANVVQPTRVMVPPTRITVGVVINDSQSGGEVPVGRPRSHSVAVLEREQKYLKQLLICKVCSKNPVKDLFLPCGELIACLECSKLLTHCPSCNTKILATVTTYFS